MSLCGKMILQITVYRLHFDPSLKIDIYRDIFVTEEEGDFFFERAEKYLFDRT